MELRFFADVVCHLKIVHVCAVFIESAANIADCAFECNGIKGNNFCWTNTRQIHLIFKQEPLNCFSVLARIVRVNISICNTGRIHKAEEVQTIPHTVHLRNPQEIRNHATWNWATTIAALDTVLLFPLTQVSLEQHKVNWLRCLINIELFIDSFLQLFLCVMLERIWVVLNRCLNLVTERLLWFRVDMWVLCTTI